MKPSQLPDIVQLWRSVCQWIGGVGIAVFAVYLIVPAAIGRGIYSAENHSWKPVGRLKGIAGRMILIYSVITLACIVSLATLGMPVWEALNHGLTITSTGGLTVTDDSFTGYSFLIQAVSCIFMLAGSLSFAILYNFGKLKFLNVWSNSALKGFTLWIFILVIAAALIEYQAGTENIGCVIFNLCSAITTCGVSCGEINYSRYTYIVFILAMFIGGLKDSTAGGFKLDRLIWMNKVVIWQLKRNLTPKSEDKLPEWNCEKYSKEVVYQRSSQTLAVALLFSVTFLVGSLLLCVVYGSDANAIFQCASNLGAVGLSMGVGGPERSELGKFVEIVLMIAGRLEILPLLMIIPVMLGRIPEKIADTEADSKERKKNLCQT